MDNLQRNLRSESRRLCPLRAHLYIALQSTVSRAPQDTKANFCNRTGEACCVIQVRPSNLRSQAPNMSDRRTKLSYRRSHERLRIDGRFLSIFDLEPVRTHSAVAVLMKSKSLATYSIYPRMRELPKTYVPCTWLYVSARPGIPSPFVSKHRSGLKFFLGFITIRRRFMVAIPF